MPTGFLLPILLRIAGPLAFIVATVTAGAMNRSIILVPLLALAATVTTVLIRVVTPSPVTDLQAALDADPHAQRPHPAKGSGRRLAIGLVGYTFLFGAAALIAALFQTTEFEPQLRTEDVWFFVLPPLVALIGAWASARLGVQQMASMMGQMQSMFGDLNARQNEAEAYTFEGEIIDPDPDDTSRH